MTDELLTEADVAAMTTLDPSTLRHWRRRGEGPRWVRLGKRRIAYPRSAVEQWLTECANRAS